MSIILRDDRSFGGTAYPAGTTLSLDGALEANLVAQGLATWAGEAPYQGGPTQPVQLAVDDRGNVTGLAGPDGNSVFYGPLTDSEWMKIPSVFRLRLTGTGMCVLDAQDSLGNITTGIESFTVSGATDQIEFPYVGDDAVQIRATLTGTCTAEVI